MGFLPFVICLIMLVKVQWPAYEFLGEPESHGLLIVKFFSILYFPSQISLFERLCLIVSVSIFILSLNFNLLFD